MPPLIMRTRKTRRKDPIMSTMINTTVRQAGGMISSRIPFRAGSMSGRFVTAANLATLDTGELPVDLARDFRAAVSHPDTMVYAVWSYRTPIAWVRCDRLAGRPVAPAVVPHVAYSPTTGRQQSIARVALDVERAAGEPVRVAVSNPVPYGSHFYV